MILELSVGLTYYFLTPNGPHRTELIAIGIFSLASALIGLSLVRFVAPTTWRTGFSTCWMLFAGVIVTWSAHLDRGIDSPLIVLFVLPIASAALRLPVRYVLICGAATLGEITYVWLDEPSKTSFTTDTAMLAAVIVGLIVFAVGFAVARTRIEEGEEQLEQQLTYRAETDSLTGCLNHGTFYQRLDAEVSRSLRHEEPLCLLIIDVDLFKAFNDAYGHVAGDDVLAKIGHVLRDECRNFDLVGRIGGDEFAVALPSTSATEAALIAHRLMDATASRGGARVTVSVGSASLDVEAPTASQLVRAADASLYRAKTQGRNQMVHAHDRSPLPSGLPRRGAYLRDANLKLAEERIREANRATSEAMSILDAYQSTASVGLGFADQQFRMIRINPMLASIQGGSVERQLGRTIEEIVPVLWAQLEPMYRSVLKNAQPVSNLEAFGETPTDPGVTHCWLTNLYPVQINEEVIGIGIVVVDITDRKRLEQSQIHLTRSVVAALAGAVEIRDPYTAGHEARVADTAVLIATELGLSVVQIEAIKLAGQIHDIGKLAIPAEILSRPGRLSEPEMELIRTHSRAGYDMLTRVDFPSDVRDIVLQHHERLNGSGYPSGLRGDEVSIGARIVAVADVFDAIVSDRPYRASLGSEFALHELTSGAGTLYDPNVVSALVTLFATEAITA